MNYLLCHGSPDSEHRLAVDALAQQVAAQLGADVQALFLGNELADGLLEGSCVLPLFLTWGWHLSHDVPAMMEGLSGHMIPGPADYPEVMAAMALDLAMAERKRQRAVMFALYRLLGAEALMADLYRVSKKFPLPCIAGLHGECDVRSVLNVWHDDGVSEALIQPVLLFPGKSLACLESLAGDSHVDVSVGRPLVEHPDFVEWLVERFRQAH